MKFAIRSVILTSAFCVMVAQAANSQEKGCYREAISNLASPDGIWMALVYADLCSHGPAFTTVMLDKVQLVRRGEELRQDGDVIVLDQSSNPAGRPLTQWLSPQKVQIKIPKNSIITLKKSGHEGVEIILKFDPENPVERQRFLKERGLPPD
jgi:hypothetical protein